jgi:YjbE family integral membrane protein
MNPATAAFLLKLFKIVLIDVTLAGDNAVVIALAVKSLPAAQRRAGTLFGALGAIVARVFITFFAARILELPLFKFAGGLLILWIAVKLLIDTGGDPDAKTTAHSLRQAIWMILVADITMSTDNILAVAATSGGSAPLLIAGLAISISFVVFMSGLLARIMDRYPIIVWGGAAILGQVAGSMIATDPWLTKMLVTLPWTPRVTELASETAMAILVLITGWAIKKSRKKPDRPNVS